MSSITADDGVRLDYTVSGDPAGRPVVLLAGFKAAATTWRYQLKPLQDAGYRVIAVDLRGHGTSERPAEGVDMARRGADVHAVLERLDLNDVVLIGGSMGGNTIWAYLQQHGAARVGAVVIVDQTPKMLNTPDWPHGFYGYDASNVDTYFAERIPDTGHGTPIARRGMRLVRLLRLMKGADAGALSEGELALLDDHAKKDWRPVIAATSVPVLFVAGAESEFWPSAHAVAAAALASRGTAVVLANDGHAANMEQPKAFNRAVLQFLAGAS
ncbi:alpha/beta fold hydrolase [Microbacterium terricola]|uniref:Alpha/beta hydrolase n=1 Tax=Microbacterium terricola TaxID=344163 RepID=A0ABM8E042_9MICO|nr:alpha/beta hydrolase [Microbacterium terricola]UYK41079.1 alpha/beta hydrolase [Microbacterium terricola]BDV31162.1 alpha/beta hydrolase [Microbacterium terricola]